MSYDASMMIDTGRGDVCVADIGNCTSNVSPMWTKALGHPLRDLHGQSGEVCAAALVNAVQHIRCPENRASYEAMNPANGWGSHEGAAQFLEKILRACERHPKARLHLWY